ncbi:MAG: peptidylprolyl isomerase [Acidobacteria bacterium]|nr:peptidylprolyl isomerase [Acidobacteriota bacterium]
MCLRSALLHSFLAVGWLVGAASPVPAQQPPAPGAASEAPVAEPDPQQRVVVSVDEAKLTVADVENILQTLPLQSREYYSGPGRHLLPQYLVRMKVLSEEAQKQKLDQQPEIRNAIGIATESILADAARRQIAQKIAAPEDLVAQLYQARKKEFEEVRLRRILIRTEESILSQTSVANRPPLSSADARKKLEEFRRQILEGADFAELARANSDDGASAPSGGDLGFVNYLTLIPPIAQAADRLAAGDVSEVIPTAFGMELIQVVEKRIQPLEQVRSQLEATLRQGKLEEKLQELQNQHKIFVDAEYFAPQAGAPAPFGTMAAPGGAPSGR